ncbi:MAG: hypothetical protein ACOX5G_06435 [Kiritimatiellia bacterium]
MRPAAVSCVLGWRVFWMTLLNGTDGCAPAPTVSTARERAMPGKMAPEMRG